MPIKSEVAQLLLHCPDKPGILAEVTDFITVNKGNIVYLDQYVDHAENVFFMRIAWELDGFLIPKEKIEDYFQTLYGRKYQMIFRLYFSDVKPRMAVFVSRMSHCLYDMLARYTAGEWNVEIPLIVSNHPDLEHVARRFDIPFYLFPITKQNKERQEAEEMRLLAENRINFIVLARYMQIVSEKMIEAYPNRIINIHHSFLPAFVGARPYRAGRENHRRYEPLRDHRAGRRTDHRAGNRPDYAQGHDRGSGQQGKGSGKDRAVESRPKAHRAKGTGVQKQDGHFQLTTVTARDGIA